MSERIFYYDKFLIDVSGKLDEQKVKEIMQKIRKNYNCITWFKITDIKEKDGQNIYTIGINLGTSTYEYYIPFFRGV